MNLQQLEDDFFSARDRLFGKPKKKPRLKVDCNTGHHDYKRDSSYDDTYNWMKCKICGMKCLGLKENE